MAEQSAFDRENIELQTMSQTPGLLEQFNLPPAVIVFIRRNQRTIWLAVAACLIVVVAVSVYVSYRDYRSGKAASALNVALMAPKDNRQLLEKVGQDYSSTPSGLWARLELAFLDDKEGQEVQAITRLEAIKTDLSAKSLLKPLVIGKLAVLYENGKQFDKALALYTELATQEGYTIEAYRALGRVNEQLGKKAEALAMYTKYLESADVQAQQATNDPVREMVQSRINQLGK
jgi:predicted negative regulator of RcsB-dependent stress response